MSLKGIVAPHVSALVVDGLESVKIRERQSSGIQLTSRGLHLVIAESHECPAIVETGEFIGLR